MAPENDRACLVCRGDLGPSRIPGLLACRCCGFLTADIQLGREQLRALYGAAYFQGQEYRDYVSERRLIEKNFRKRLRRLLQHIPAPGSKRLLEIGCAYGFFLSVAKQYFHGVEGIDISGAAVEYARNTLGLDVSDSDFLASPPRRTYDAVCLWDTLEHLDRPDLYLERIAACLSPGGVVAITTGDIGSLMARWRGARWRQIHPPTHLHYFSRKTLSALLSRYGFRVRYSGYDGLYRSVDTMLHGILVVKQRRPELYRRVKGTGLLRGDMYLNLGDLMFLIAERQPEPGSVARSALESES